MRIGPSLVLALLLVAPACLALAQEQKAKQPEPDAIPVERFDKLLALIKPQAGELRFHEIPWLINVHDARVEAAAQGKPILVWSGAGGAPIGVC